VDDDDDDTKDWIFSRTEYWDVKNQRENKLSLAEMMMLHWMCRKTRWDMIINDSIRES